MLKQTLSHKLLQKLSPQQIKLMKLIQLPMLELEQRIKEHIDRQGMVIITTHQAMTVSSFERYRLGSPDVGVELAAQ